MSLKFKILDEDNTAITDKGDFEFFENENRILKVQIIDDFTGDERLIATGGTINIIVPGITSDIILSGVIDGSNRSVVTVSLSQANTLEMTSGNILGEIIENSDKRVVKGTLVLRKLSKSDD